MKITRLVNGQNLDFELTRAEIVEAHDEFVISFMKNVMMDDFGVEDEDTALSLAEDAYDIYCRGDGLTEYECCEQAYDESGLGGIL